MLTFLWSWPSVCMESNFPWAKGSLMQGPSISKSQKEKWRLKFHLKQNYRSAECVFITKMHHCLFVLLCNKQGVKKIVETMLRPSSLWEITNELEPPGDGLVLRQSSPWFQRQDLSSFSTWNRWTPHRHLWWGRGRTASPGGRSRENLWNSGLQRGLHNGDAKET